MEKLIKKADATRERLLTHARRLMWARGYGSVSLRQIAQAAGVDVALISRYFGSKRGLFEATVQDAFVFPDVKTPDALIDAVVEVFVTAPRGGPDPSPIRMLLMNIHDDDVGDLVREIQAQRWQRPMSKVLHSETRAALLMAAVLGLSVAEKSLHLNGIAQVGTPAYEAQIRHLFTTALTFSE